MAHFTNRYRPGRSEPRLIKRDNGIALQTYAAILACLLIALWTGRKPTLRTVEMIRFYFSGWADAEELQAHIARLGEQPKPQA